MISHHGLKHIPAFRLLIPFITGIIIQPNFPAFAPYVNYYWVSVFILFFALLLTLLNRSFYLQWMNGLFIFLFLMLSGSLLLSQKQMYEKVPDKQEKALTFGKIIHEPEEKEKSIKLILNARVFLDSSQYSLKKLLIYIEKDSLSDKLQLNDGLFFASYINTPENNGNPHEFDYKRYLSHHGINYQTYISAGNWKKVQIQDQEIINLVHSAKKIRKLLIHELRAHQFRGDELAVASALLLGKKDYIDDKLRDSFSSTGAMHVLAVSGLHVGIIFLIINLVLRFMDKNPGAQKLKFIIIILAIWGFAFITGLSPSVSRASVMFTLLTIGKMMNRDANVYNTIFFSAFLLLVWNPYFIYDVGFQLSYAAVLSIIYFQPRIYRLMPIKYLAIEKVWALITVSLAAQLGTLPIALFYFHQFPTYFILTNIIVIPFAFIILITGVIFFISTLFPVIPVITGNILHQMIFWLNTSISYIHELPHSSIKNISLHEMDLIFLGISYLFLLMFLERKKMLYIRFLMTTIAILLAFNLYEKTIQNDQRKITVYHVNKHHVLELMEGRQSILLNDIKEKDFAEKAKYSVKNNWRHHGINKKQLLNPFAINVNDTLPRKMKLSTLTSFNDSYILNFQGIRMVIIKGTRLLAHRCRCRLKADYIILTGDTKFPVQKLKDYFDYEMVILDSSNSYYWRQKIISRLNKLGIDYHSIHQHGAYELRL